MCGDTYIITYLPLVSHCMQLLHTALKHNKFDTSEEEQLHMLDPFVPLLSDSLTSHHLKVLCRVSEMGPGSGRGQLSEVGPGSGHGQLSEVGPGSGRGQLSEMGPGSGRGQLARIFTDISNICLIHHPSTAM